MTHKLCVFSSKVKMTNKQIKFVWYIDFLCFYLERHFKLNRKQIVKVYLFQYCFVIGKYTWSYVQLATVESHKSVKYGTFVDSVTHFLAQLSTKKCVSFIFNSLWQWTLSEVSIRFSLGMKVQPWRFRSICWHVWLDVVSSFDRHNLQCIFQPIFGNQSWFVWYPGMDSHDYNAL